ncbi:type II toxin-antitoxin system RatA family toxin [Pleionea sediminis]|uniref:type II toxin-antitoxin system RatA family toxin n=1 Tax=Pleionea sediminis TaxID=2569479 RepID=UPI001184BC2C|nr:type II toxin-antitoxin system RatA family toxin [Pleionea sediminis]
MPKIEKSAIVPFSARDMFKLVNNVEEYPEFIDGCSGAQIIESTSTTMKAQLEVSKSGFSNAFTTENTLTENKQIRMTLVDGPFKYLIGTWNFSELEQEACKIEFTLDFEFKSRLIAMAFGKTFLGIADSMMSSFIKRAKQIYGSSDEG